MNEITQQLFEKFTWLNNQCNSIIKWASPVPFFGNIEKAKIATLGINPSNKEFENNSGVELSGSQRRFHTLNSLNINSWSQLDEEKYDLIYKSWINYFKNNPYDAWFKRLDKITIESGYSYYFPYENICHLDLIPFATSEKWLNVPFIEKTILLEASLEILSSFINKSNITTLILNGQSVVSSLERATRTKFQRIEIPELGMKRKNAENIKGYVYTGIVTSIGSVSLKNNLYILGYNHNIQSSYGVSNNHTSILSNWLKVNLSNNENR